MNRWQLLALGPTICLLFGKAIAAHGFPIEVPRPGASRTSGHTKDTRNATHGIRKERRAQKPEETNRRAIGPEKKAEPKPTFLPKIERPKHRPPTAPGNPTGAMEFPGPKLGTFLEKLSKHESRPVSKRVRDQEAAALAELVPPGRYRFSGSCALELYQGRLKAAPTCFGIPPEIASLANLVVEAPDLRYFSSPTGGMRSLQGVLRLTHAEIKAGGVVLQWVVEELKYANPYLEALRRRFPHLPEETRLHAAYVSLVFPELLAIASGETDVKRLATVLRSGDSLYFSEQCPLRVVNPPEYAPAEVRTRLTLSMSCPAAGRLGRIALSLPPGAALPEGMEAGTKLSGHVRLAGIVRDGRQLRMVWDSISNIRILKR